MASTGARTPWFGLLFDGRRTGKGAGTPRRGSGAAGRRADQTPDALRPSQEHRLGLGALVGGCR